MLLGALICAVLSSFIQSYLLASPATASKLWSSSFAPPKNASFDYIVVGGGTAGNAIAARLAEDPTVSVAIIEAGGFYEIDNGNGSVVPALCYSQYTGTVPEENLQPKIDWDYATVPQKVGVDQLWSVVQAPFLLRTGSCRSTNLLSQRQNIGR